ncbi:MAG TPA: glycoside hydrolase domain-containing protein, partial [Puia sp.]|nr:glycoside hydrolase domain-containing protein [Puia sp.]
RQLLYTPSLLLLPKEGDSFRLTPGNSGYKEGDAWVYTYFAPQDAGGLIDRMGGDAYFAARLDAALQDGRIVFDNETVLHLPYFFNEAGRHDLTRQWVLRLMNQRYSDQPGGLPGNDDLGAMSSWYVFSAMGFFPFSPGRAAYEIGAPLFRKAVIRLDGKKKFVIRLSDSSSGLTLNGQPYSSTLLPHQLISSGGEMVFGQDVVLNAEQRSKPEFALSGTNVSKYRVLPGEINWVHFSLTNTGATGVNRIVLLADGREVESRNYYVEGHQERVDSIAFRLYQAGAVKLTLSNNSVEAANLTPGNSSVAAVKQTPGNNSVATIQVVPPPGPLPKEPEVID